MYENISKIRFSGAAFTNLATLNIFPKKEDRLAAIYGPNGSGKSTIARAFKKINGAEDTEITSAVLLDSNDLTINFSQPIDLKIHVFDEEFVQKNVQLKEDGLETIVILGSRVDLEDKIRIAQKQYDNSVTKFKQCEENNRKYLDVENTNSPQYRLNKIKNRLSGDGRWADRERIIAGYKRNASVTEEVYEAIVGICPEVSLIDLTKEYEHNLELLEKAKSSNAKILESAHIFIPQNICEEELYELLGKKIEMPILSERERKLMRLVKTGRLEEIKTSFSDDKVETCPFCFQHVSKEYKENLIVSIEKILSKEVDDHKDSLRRVRLPQVEFDFSPFWDKLDKEIINSAQKALDEFNYTSALCQKDIDNKISDPYKPILDKNYQLHQKRFVLEEGFKKLEIAREEYNNQFEDTRAIITRLQRLNKQIAYYEILDLHKQYILKKTEAASSQALLTSAEKNMNNFKSILQDFLDQKKNINIAVDIINHNLRYIFFSENRLEIKAVNGEYSLLSDGMPVKPCDVSVAERNIIGLSYFFTKILTGLEIKDGYSDEMLIVLDDPISSMDRENKIGIMSFLRAQLEALMKDNSNTKALILTHDLLVQYNLQKIFDDIGKSKKITANFRLWELENKAIKDFLYKRRNEYNAMLKVIYGYAKKGSCGNNNLDFSIGNTMRRVLEAYSTFIYRKGIGEVSCDENIINAFSCDEYKAYFGNLMYRLVLDGDSHMEERTVSGADLSFMEIISPREKKVTAQDIICFMYLLNPAHVLAHLDNLGDVENEIKRWCNRIKQTNAR